MSARTFRNSAVLLVAVICVVAAFFWVSLAAGLSATPAPSLSYELTAVTALVIIGASSGLLSVRATRPPIPRADSIRIRANRPGAWSLVVACGAIGAAGLLPVVGYHQLSMINGSGLVSQMWWLEDSPRTEDDVRYHDLTLDGGRPPRLCSNASFEIVGAPDEFDPESRSVNLNPSSATHVYIRAPGAEFELTLPAFPFRINTGQDDNTGRRGAEDYAGDVEDDDRIAPELRRVLRRSTHPEVLCIPQPSAVDSARNTTLSLTQGDSELCTFGYCPTSNGRLRAVIVPTISTDFVPAGVTTSRETDDSQNGVVASYCSGTSAVGSLADLIAVTRGSNASIWASKVRDGGGTGFKSISTSTPSTPCIRFIDKTWATDRIDMTASRLNFNPLVRLTYAWARDAESLSAGVGRSWAATTEASGTHTTRQLSELLGIPSLASDTSGRTRRLLGWALSVVFVATVAFVWRSFR